VIVGLLLLGVTSLAFGFVEQIVLLDVTRFVQGVAGALIWSGALTWLVTTAPEDRRGQVIGTALGTAVAGALLGPALGALAGTVGTEPVFASVLVLTVVLAAIASRFPEARVSESQDLREVWATMLSRPVLNAVLFVAVPSLMFGAIEVLVPLRIDALGGGHGVIAAGFIAGAALEAVLAPLAGRYSDRVGRRLPYVSGLSVCAVAMVGVGVAASLGGVLAALIVTSLGAGFCFAPAMTMLSDAAAATDLHQGFAAGLSNMAWATGQVLGGIGGGVVASLTGNALPSYLIAALLLATVLYAFRALAPRQSDARVVG
jgi:MFS family permease